MRTSAMKRTILKIGRMGLFVVLLAFGLRIGFAPPAAAETGAKIRTLTETGHRLLWAWQHEKAGEIARTLLDSGDHSPETLYFLGHYYFEIGEYEKALDDLNGAGDFRPAFMAKNDYAPYLLAAYENTKDFEKKRSEHFEFRYAEGLDELLADSGLEVLEKTYAALAEDLGFRPERRVVAEIYPRLEMLARATGLTVENLKTSGVIAICKFGRLMVTSPRVSPFGFAWRDTLNHEYVHLAISSVSANTVPVWLHEGLAKFHEERWRMPRGGQLEAGSESLLARALKEDKLVTLEQIHPSMAYLPSQDHTALAFAEVLTMIQWLDRLRGADGFKKLLGALREGLELDAAFRQVYGFDVNGLQRRWRTDIGHRRLRMLDYQFDDYSILFDGADENAEEREIRKITKRDGRNHMTLGKLLKDREHPKASVAEFEKAENVLGPGHPRLANFMAESFLEMGAYDRAAARLLPALDLSPNYLPSHVRIATAYTEMGRYEDALKHLDYAAGINPFDPRIYALEVRCNEELQRPEKARRARKILERVTRR